MRTGQNQSCQAGGQGLAKRALERDTEAQPESWVQAQGGARWEMTTPWALASWREQMSLTSWGQRLSGSDCLEDATQRLYKPSLPGHTTQQTLAQDPASLPNPSG